MRDQLLECFQRTLESIHGEQCVRDALHNHSIVSEQCHVIAIGKAALAMALGAEKALADKLKSGLLITKHQHGDTRQLSEQWQCYEAAHPVPDQSSLEAGVRLLEFVNTNTDLPILFLISGGTSSLVEVLPEKISLEQWQKMNQWLLASGFDIGFINAVRKSVSAIKGGKLLQHLVNREVHALLISDVPGDYPHIIGSGLLFTSQQQVLTDNQSALPEWLDQLIKSSNTSDDSRALKPARLSSQKIIASNRMAMEAAAEFARDAGYPVFIHDDFLQGDAQQAGVQLANYLQHEANSGFHIWGGETTMLLPDNPGRGGRNQHLALSAASVLAGNEEISLLAAGTDGSDGPTEDAGAIIDGGTISRGQLAGLDVEDSLARADSGHFLEAAGDLLYTGPTGTNVMDLVIAMKKA